jgi:hypothetical protein
MSSHLMWAAGGALSFWLPVILVFAVERSSVNLLIANLAAMLGFLVCWAVRRWIYPDGRQSIWILLGLYFFGPVLLGSATTFANGGFTQIHGWADIRWLLFASIFPPIQFLLAATTGLWPSLLIVTAILIWMSATERFGHLAP